MNESKLQEHLQLLGMRVADKVTGFSGVVTSICFDLYGCIQALVNPGLDKEGKQRDSNWFDVPRLKLIGDTPVMDRPEWVSPAISDGKKGPAEKPVSRG